MTVGDRIKNRRIELGLTIEQLSNALNISRATAYRYEGNYIDKLPVTTLEPLAKVLRTTPAYLMGWEEDSDVISISNVIPFSQVAKKKVQVLGEIACGEPIYAQEQYGNFIDCDVDADFALTCRGDSMIDARINDGDLVFIKKQDTVENGAIAAVIIENEATLKRVFYYPQTKKLVLQAANPNYEPFVYVDSELENVRILGRAVAFQSLL